RLRTARSESPPYSSPPDRRAPATQRRPFERRDQRARTAAAEESKTCRCSGIAASMERALIAGALAGVLVAGTQSPTSPRLAGEAPPPASRLSLWYRAPASDHPLLTVGASPEARQAAAAEWVRALPVGNGR